MVAPGGPYGPPPPGAVFYAPMMHHQFGPPPPGWMPMPPDGKGLPPGAAGAPAPMGPNVRGVPDMQYLAAQGAMRGAAYADGEQPKKAARKRKNAPKYNNAIRHFVAYVKSNGLDPEQAVVFVHEDGTVKDDELRNFAIYLHDQDTVTDSVFRNCLKWMQKNLEAQFSKLKLPTPKAYLYRKLNAEQRHEAPPQASTKFTV
ncbi:hypothetical protein JL721_7980 [Aureococcus anophagefferens]|nr:hypothetical protein JL721_7980 [Aureococcus anophagefferens]